MEVNGIECNSPESTTRPTLFAFDFFTFRRQCEHLQCQLLNIADQTASPSPSAGDEALGRRAATASGYHEGLVRADYMHVTHLRFFRLLLLLQNSIIRLSLKITGFTGLAIGTKSF